MAMTNCKECGNEISTSARSCPKCGAVVPKAKVWPWIVGIPVALFVIMMIYGSTIPDYEHRARVTREVCEKIASPRNRHECQRTYDQAIAEGKARGDK